MLFLIYLLIFKPCLCFDPDIDICKDEVPDSAVVTNTGFAHIFKGKYYWNISHKIEHKNYSESLENIDGIEGYAGLITDRWPHLTDKIRASFTILSGQTSLGLTIFIVKNNWFVYRTDDYVKYPILYGSTNNWPNFSELEVNVVFTDKRLLSKVFVIHNKLRNYTLYDFGDFIRDRKPTFIETNYTFIRRDYWVFLKGAHRVRATEELVELFGSKEYRLESGKLNELFDLKAVLTFETRVFMISDLWVQFCYIENNNKNLRSFDDTHCKRNPQYRTKSVLFNCPLNIDKRPTTLPTTGYLTVITETSTSIQTQSTKASKSISEVSVNSNAGQNDDSIVISKKLFISLTFGIILIILGLFAIIFITFNVLKPTKNSEIIKTE